MRSWVRECPAVQWPLAMKNRGLPAYQTQDNLMKSLLFCLACSLPHSSTPCHHFPGSKKKCLQKGQKYITSSDSAPYPTFTEFCTGSGSDEMRNSTEASRSLGLGGQLDIHSKFQASQVYTMRPYLKKEKFREPQHQDPGLTS